MRHLLTPFPQATRSPSMSKRLPNAVRARNAQNDLLGRRAGLVLSSSPGVAGAGHRSLAIGLDCEPYKAHMEANGGDDWRYKGQTMSRSDERGGHRDTRQQVSASVTGNDGYPRLAAPRALSILLAPDDDRVSFLGGVRFVSRKVKKMKRPRNQWVRWRPIALPGTICRALRTVQDGAARDRCGAGGRLWIGRGCWPT
jgi:hypothetical protein